LFILSSTVSVVAVIILSLRIKMNHTTQLKEFQEQILNSRKEYEDIIESFSEGMVIVEASI
jgi:hypothetical protein